MKKLIFLPASRFSPSLIGYLLSISILSLLIICQVNAQTAGTSPLDVSDFSFMPSVIDTSNDSQIVTVTIRVTNFITDVTRVYVQFRSVTGNQFVSVSMNSQSRISGDGRDGIYRGTAIFPQNSKSGKWYVFEINAFDTFNYRNFYPSDLAARNFFTELQVISISEDVAPPEVIEFNFTPSTIDTTDGLQNVTVTARVTDAQAGVRSFNVDFRRIGDDYLYPVSMNRISGNNKDGIYQGNLTLSSADGPGIYDATVSASDALGNSRYLHAGELSKYGFAAQLQVFGMSIRQPKRKNIQRMPVTKE